MLMAEYFLESILKDESTVLVSLIVLLSPLTMFLENKNREDLLKFLGKPNKIFAPIVIVGVILSRVLVMSYSLLILSLLVIGYHFSSFFSLLLVGFSDLVIWRFIDKYMVFRKEPLAVRFILTSFVEFFLILGVPFIIGSFVYMVLAYV